MTWLDEGRKSKDMIEVREYKKVVMVCATDEILEASPVHGITNTITSFFSSERKREKKQLVDGANDK